MYTQIHRATKTKLEQELTTLLAADVEALRIWLASQQATAAAIASTPDVRRLAQTLVELGRRPANSPRSRVSRRTSCGNSAPGCSPCWRRTATQGS